jgi:hypothetical protein
MTFNAPRTVDEVPIEDLDAYIELLKDQVSRREAAVAGGIVSAAKLRCLADELRKRIQADVDALDTLEAASERIGIAARANADRAEQEWLVLAALRARRALIGKAAA